MVTVSTKYSGDLRTEAVHDDSGSSLVTDAPLDNEGRGEYFSPTDLVATALGCCILTIMGLSAKKYEFSIDGVTMKTTKIMVKQPRRIGEIVVEFYFPPNNYTDKQKKMLQLAAETCPVAKSLHPEIKQTLIYHFNS